MINNNFPETTHCDSLFGQALDHLERGNVTAAEQALHTVLTLMPQSSEAMGQLGELLASTGEMTEAARWFTRATAFDPDRIAWLDGLAQAQTALVHTPEAEVSLRLMLARRPGSATTHRRLGRCLLRQGRRNEGLDNLNEAARLDPYDPFATADIVEALIEAGEPLAALELAQPALRAAPEHPPLHLRLGDAWAALGETAKANTLFRRACELAIDYGDNDTHQEAERRLNRSQAIQDQPVAPAAAYIRALFDRYADDFDRHLTGGLDYQVPELLREAVLSRPELACGGLRVLDLGCGTGLCAASVHGLTTTLAGVDLSPRMIERARARAIYDHLRVGDLFEALAEPGPGWDLIVAADVLAYLGPLGPLLTAVAAALGAKGRFMATVERLDDDNDQVRLLPSRRYAHSLGHIRATAAAARLVVLDLTAITVRQEAGYPVCGLLMVLGPSPPIGRV
ncbi:putative TPR repeat methyltransferase [uncultured Gammaproteobacteria bacterium]